MKLNYPIALIVCFFINTTIFAQNPMPCGLHDHEVLIERLLQNKKYIKEIGVNQKDGIIDYVPVKYHLVGRSNGTGRIATRLVMDMHCLLNEFFSDGDDGIQFYIKDEFNYIDSDETFNDHGGNQGQNVLNNNRVNNAINIFIPNDANPPGYEPDPDNPGTILGYFSPGADWIVIRKANVNGYSLTAPHELGHYFSLPHPFNGWGNTPYNVDDHGETVGPNSPFPYSIPNEKMDGSNCETAGDFICDTPPSYLFFGWNGCDYSGGARDPDGVLVDPDELNIMDYFDDECAPKYFSPDQKEIILADYETTNSIQSSWTPPGTIIEGSPTIVEPLDQDTTDGFETIVFEWEPVTGADRYLIEIDRITSFTLDPIIEVVNGTSLTLSDVFIEDKSYFWRIRPYNLYNTCAATSNIFKFTAGAANVVSSNNNVLAIDNFRIEPNPVAQNQVNISLDTQTAFDGVISIVSTTGQTLQVTTQQFNVGHIDIELSIEDIPNGMYLVNIKSADKIITKKMIVTK